MTDNELPGSYEHDLLSGPMQAWAGRMIAAFEGIKRKHHGESGRRREDDVREFLRAFLPQRLGIATGEIAASDGSVSPQVDLIVYDRLETPLLDNSESSAVVPVEGVYGVIEVSSHLDTSKLNEDIAKIRRIKALPKKAFLEAQPLIARTYAPHGIPQETYPVLGFCFAYEGASLDTLNAEVQGPDREDVSDNVDAICVLNRGLIANARLTSPHKLDKLFGAPQPDTIRISIPQEDENTGGTLMLFYLLAGGLLMQGNVERINMGAYLGR
jgi:hypothetical protein